VRALVSRKLNIPVLAIIGENGAGGHHRPLVEAFAERLYDDVVLSGAGNFIPEEWPRETLAAIVRKNEVFPSVYRGMSSTNAVANFTFSAS
jgi:hypothetical protein